MKTGEALQCAGAGRSDDDPSSRQPGAGAHRTSQRGGLAKSYGERLRGCNVRNLNPEKAEGLSPELQRALEPLLSAIAELSERICEYNDRIEACADELHAN